MGPKIRQPQVQSTREAQSFDNTEIKPHLYMSWLTLMLASGNPPTQFDGICLHLFQMLK